MSEVQQQNQPSLTLNNKTNISNKLEENKINPQYKADQQYTNTNAQAKDENIEQMEQNIDCSKQIGEGLVKQNKKQRQQIDQNDKQEKQNEDNSEKEREQEQNILNNDFYKSELQILNQKKEQQQEKSNQQNEIGVPQSEQEQEEFHQKLQKQNEYPPRNKANQQQYQEEFLTIQKKKINNQSFLWGEQQNKQQIRQRTYEHLFINDPYKSEQILQDTRLLSKKIRLQNQKIKRNIISSKGKKMTKPIVPDDVDIWSNIKNAMLQKSRSSQQSKSLNSVKSHNTKENTNFGQKIMANNSRQKNQKKSGSNKSSQIFKQQKRFILKIGRSPLKNEESINNIEQMRKMIAEKVKRWRHEQKQIQLRRNNKFQSQRQRIKLQQQKQLQEQRIKKEKLRKQRVQAISLKLKKKRQRKQAQTSPQHLNKSSIKNVQKSHTQRNKELNEKKQKRKNDHGEKIKLSSPIIKQFPPQQELSILWNRKVDNYQSQKQKLVRKYFEQKKKKMPIQVNQNKKLKILISADKSSNPLKYQLLQKKGMNDVQIYNSTFKLPQDHKKLGNQYLRQVLSRNKSDDLRRYMSQESILNMPKYQRNWKSPIIKTLVGKQQNSNLEISKILRKQEEKKRQIIKQDDQYLNYIKR